MQSLTKPNVILFTALFLLYYSTWVSKQLSIMETKGMVERGVSHRHLPNKKVRCAYQHLGLYHQVRPLRWKCSPEGYLLSHPIPERKAPTEVSTLPRHWGSKPQLRIQASCTHWYGKQPHPWVRRNGTIFTAYIFKPDYQVSPLTSNYNIYPHLQLNKINS